MVDTADPAQDQDPKDSFAPHADRLASKLDELREVIRASRQDPAPAPAPQREPETWSPEQLQALVDEGKITSAQMINQLRLQDRREIQQELSQRIDKEKATAAAEAQLNARIAPYVQAMPELARADSDRFKQFDTRRKALIAEGYADDLRTQLTALRLEFGDPSSAKIEETTTQRTARSAETTTPPSRRTQDGKPRSGKDPLSGFDDREREHYEKMVRSGQFKGWEDERLQKILDRHRKQKEAAA